MTKQALQLWMILILASCTRMLSVCKDTKAISIVSVQYNTRKDISYKTFMLFDNNYAFHSEVTDRSMIDSLCDRVALILNDTTHLRKSEYIDARIACIIHNTDRSSDTIGLGWFGMEINGRYYTLDSTLLRIVSRRLPPDHQWAVDQYLNDYYDIWKDGRK